MPVSYVFHRYICVRCTGVVFNVCVNMCDWNKWFDLINTGTQKVGFEIVVPIVYVRRVPIKHGYMFCPRRLTYILLTIAELS